MTKRKFRDYQEKLIQDLQNQKLAKAYLNEALLDDDPKIFLLALKNVMQAQGEEMTQVARKAKLSRENLYRIFSKSGNPKLTSIVALLDVAGFSLAVQPNKR